MTPIDLIDYTNSAKKIPSSFLSPAHTQTEIKSSKILMAYFIDFMTISMMTVAFSEILQISFNSFMVTSSLENAFENIPFSSLTINFLPLIFTSYFFFSFFFNHGQTWGMHKMKNRIKMEELNFKSSLFWAMFSSVFIMTGGFSFLFTYKWMKNKTAGEFKGHDHLYFDLMQTRSSSPVSLIKQTETHSKTQVSGHEEESFQKAA